MERTPNWVCPVCNAAASLDVLFVDGYFENVLASTPPDVSTVIIEPNGTWHPLSKATDVAATAKKTKEVIDLTVDSEEEREKYTRQRSTEPPIGQAEPMVKEEEQEQLLNWDQFHGPASDTELNFAANNTDNRTFAAEPSGTCAFDPGCLFVRPICMSYSFFFTANDRHVAVSARSLSNFGA